MKRKPYTPNELRTLAKQTGPQWEGESRSALTYCADVIDAANSAVADAQAAVQAEREACIKWVDEHLSSTWDGGTAATMMRQDRARGAQ
jgi:hypothetical protein